MGNESSPGGAVTVTLEGTEGEACEAGCGKYSTGEAGSSTAN